MTLHALLEDFGPTIRRGGEGFPGSTAPEPEPALPEEERLAAFEKGYGEGYEDATRAAEEEHRRVGAALAGRLEDLSFTFHEARAAVEREVRDLVAAVADGVLPAMAREGFGGALVEAIEDGLAERAACPVAVSVAPEAVEVVGPLMPQVKGFPVTLRGDPDLGPGQAVIGFPDGEREVDMEAVAERARAALADWLARGAEAGPAAKEASHG